uniref:GPI ethanolamine phosphate transferase 3, catalytic subunit n=1 Tax=Strigamia maritima TaxID=126957 RepID=T1JNY3_STRMM
MTLLLNHISLLFWLLTLNTVGLYFFTRGFLLKRVVLNEKNQCNTLQKDFSPVFSSLGIPPSPCWLPRRFARAVFVIIDGLRYDFAKWNESALNPAPYENKLLTIYEVLTRHPHNSKLYKFIADAPTTTLQRIKGLTTGSLPTFIDMGSNFDTPEITEDNIIDQLVSAGKRIVFMGDDTWTGLFPGRFQTLYPFPSFNTKDLDTVDNGILEQLIPTMKSDQWDVIVAHFLGVDHCGHTYGPDHPLMGQKLNQLDLILKSVVSNLRDDSILFVLGDHGMSSSGDHGGDSREEVTSALFVYSPTIIDKSKQAADQTVLQIDLVPTVALLLGLPIPFGNLGSIIEDLVKLDDEKYSLPTAASYANAAQVNKYLQNYVAVADDFSSSDWTTVQSSYSRIKDSLSNTDKPYWENDLQQHCKNFLQLALSMCRKVWATFELSTMLCGITFTLIAILMAAYYTKLTHPIQSSTPIFCFFSSIINLSIVVFAFFQPQSEPSLLLLISLCLVVIPCLLFVVLTKPPNFFAFQTPLADGALSWLIFLIVAFSVSSNSYIINEAASLSFFLQILILVSAIYPRRIIRQVKRKWDLLTNHQIFRLLLCLLISLILRVCLYYQRCRPEQFWCVDHHLTHELTSGRQIRFLAALASVCLLAISFLAWLRHCGNLTHYPMSCIAVKYLTVFACACICYAWSLSYLPPTLRSSIPHWHSVWAHRNAFLSLGVLLFAFLCHPLLVYRSMPQASIPSFMSISVPQLFQHLKHNWRKHFATNLGDDIPVVYGLASVYSSGTVLCVFVAALGCILLLGTTFAPALFLLVTVLFLCLFLLSIRKMDLTENLDDVFNVSWTDVIIWTLLSSYFFFITGHQASISTIQWSAAFVGSNGELSDYIFPAVKVLINTFASQIIYGLGVYLLLIWPFTCQFIFPAVGSKLEFAKQGEIIFTHQEHLFMNSAFQLTSKYFCLQGLKVLLGTMLAATIHRRHLMVWALFAPRFIFEAIACLVGFASTFLSLMIIIRIHKYLGKWLTALEKKYREVVRYLNCEIEIPSKSSVEKSSMLLLLLYFIWVNADNQRSVAHESCSCDYLERCYVTADYPINFANNRRK